MTVNDKNGCQISKSITVENATINANISIANAGCTKNGVAELAFSSITPPYTVNWSNGFIGEKNINLIAGSYSVTAKDAKNCIFSTNFKITKDTLSVKPFVSNEKCNGDSEGIVQLNVLSGTQPFTFNWANGATGDYIWSVPQGTYPVTITDASGCKIALSPQVKGPEKITFGVKTSPDNPNTPNWEGKIIVENIKGGVAPYKVYWPQFNKTSISIDVLPTGSYEFIVTDALNCTMKGTAVVGELTSSKDLVEDGIQVFPNPATESINIIYEKNDRLVQINMMDINGRKINEFYNFDDKNIKLDISNLINGTYILEFVSENKTINRRLIVKK